MDFICAVNNLFSFYRESHSAFKYINYLVNEPTKDSFLLVRRISLRPTGLKRPENRRRVLRNLRKRIRNKIRVIDVQPAT